MKENVRVIGVRELKAHASAVLREVCETGAEFIISARGRPVARIEPLASGDLPLSTDGMGGSRGALSDLPRLEWDDFAVMKRLWQTEALHDE